MLYGLNDITIVPAVVSDIESRSECNPYIGAEKDMSAAFLPIFTAPMSCIIDDKNWVHFKTGDINPIIPRNIDLGSRLSLCEISFCAFSLEEFEIYFAYVKPSVLVKKYVCVDIANGHMKKLIRLCKKAKELHGDKLVLMAGNIANPKTYLEYAKVGIDYIRIGIGSGCFTSTQKVITNKGEIEISKLQVGDVVKTHTNQFQKVIQVHEYERNEELYRINNIECTGNHEFYVINSEDEHKVSDENIHNFAYWLPANQLDRNKHKLIQL